MTCPALERLAAAASNEDDGAALHATACPRCAAILRDQRELVAAARQLPDARLSASRREELAAEVMAHADLAAGSRRGRALASAAALAAVVAVLVVVMRRPAPSAAIDLAVPAVEPAAEPTVALSEHVTLDPIAEATDRAPRSADIMKLTDGELSLDATDRAPITVVIGDTSIVVRARAKLVARRGVIVTAHVFAGTADITSAGRKQVIEAGDVWTRPTEHDTDSFGAFRTGWEALRVHHYAIAIAAFDRATDEVVAEDAMFWAAIASERAGDREAAARRLRGFLERFPSSPRADTARSALERVTQ